MNGESMSRAERRHARERARSAAPGSTEPGVGGARATEGEAAGASGADAALTSAGNGNRRTPRPPAATDRPKRGHQRRRPAAPVLAFYLFKISVIGAVLVLASVIASRIAPHMSEPVDFHNINAQTKSEQMETLAGGCVDLVVVGNSMGAFGIDPTLLVADTSLHSAYNASQFGSLMSMDRQWTAEQVLPDLRPATVVVVADSVSFSSTSAALAASQRQWDHALATRQGALADADRWAARHFVLFRERSRLSDFDEWRALLLGEPAPPRFRDDTLPVELDALGHAQTGESLIGTEDEQRMMTFHMASLFNGKWEIDPSQVADLGGLLDDLTGHGVDAVVLIPPTTEQFASLHPNGQSDIDRAESLIIEVASRRGVPVADFSELTRDPANFWDTHHLNDRGSGLLSEAFAGWLNDNGVESRHCGKGD